MRGKWIPGRQRLPDFQKGGTERLFQLPGETRGREECLRDRSLGPPWKPYQKESRVPQKTPESQVYRITTECGAAANGAQRDSGFHCRCRGGGSIDGTHQRPSISGGGKEEAGRDSSRAEVECE